MLRIRAEMARRGLTTEDLKKVPVEVGLQDDDGYPHTGTLDYVAPGLTASTGTLAVRAVLANEKRALLPGNFVRVRVPLGEEPDQLLVPDRAIGTDQSGRYRVGCRARMMWSSSGRSRSANSSERLRVIEKGITADDRVLVSGLQAVTAGQKIEPEVKDLGTAAAQ